MLLMSMLDITASLGHGIMLNLSLNDRFSSVKSCICVQSDSKEE